MQRTTSLLSRLSQRASLAYDPKYFRNVSFFLVYMVVVASFISTLPRLPPPSSPPHLRKPLQLHIFARTPISDHAKVLAGDGADVADLKDAVIAKLELRAPPHLVRLLREVEGGAPPVALESRRSLEEQGVCNGCFLVAEVVEVPALAPPQALAPPPAQPLLTLEADPQAAPLAVFRGLDRSARLTVFAAAACAAAPPLAACAASGTRMWRLHDCQGQPLQWPFLQATALVERDFYARVLEGEPWLGGLPVRGARQRKLAVVGQPGIGKSSFGLWLLAKLLRAGRTVVYTRCSTKARAVPVTQHYVFHRGVAFETASAGLGAASALLSQPSVVHISDSLPPRLGDCCHKVLITSPDPDIWRGFVEKEGAVHACFPTYDLAEMEALRAAEYGDTISRQLLELRVQAYGLSTRAVLASNQWEVCAGILQALAERSLESLQLAMNEVRAPSGGAGSDIPHSLFVLQADRATLRSTGVSLRSEAVAARVARSVASRERHNLVAALHRLMRSSATRSVAGSVFELAALDMLGSGSPLPVMQPLLAARRAARGGAAAAAAAATGASLALPFPVPAASQASQAVVHRFDTLHQLAGKCQAREWDLRKHTFRPTSPNFAAVDLVGPGLLLYQITVSRSSHELKVTSGRSEGEGLLAIYQRLLPLLSERWEAAAHHLDVCFVVPCGAAWGVAQHLTLHSQQRSAGGPAVELVEAGGAGGAAGGFSVDGRVVQVRQYVLELPEGVFEDWLAMAQAQEDALDKVSRQDSH